MQMLLRQLLIWSTVFFFFASSFFFRAAVCMLTDSPSHTQRELSGQTIVLAQGFLFFFFFLFSLSRVYAYLNKLEEGKRNSEINMKKKNEVEQLLIFLCLMASWRKNFVMLMGTRFYEKHGEKKQQQQQQQICNNNNNMLKANTQVKLL